MKHLITLMALVIYSPVAFGQYTTEYVAQHWNTPGEAELISTLTLADISDAPATGAHRVYLQMLLVRANTHVGRHPEALRRLQAIELNTIDHEPTFWDVMLYKGYAYQNNKKPVRADSVFNRYLEQVPKNPAHYPVLSIGYNNYAMVRDWHLDFEHAAALYDSATKYTALLTEDDTYAKNRRILNATNKAIHFAEVDVLRASTILQSVDTAGADVESKMQYLLAEATLYLEAEQYEASIGLFTQVRDWATQLGYNQELQRSIRGGSKAVLLLKAHERAQQINTVISLIAFLAVGAGMIYMYVKGQREVKGVVSRYK